jgi:hypothetical protein
MIYTIISLIPFILIFYYFTKYKSKESILFDIKIGLRCYSCKEEIIKKEEYYQTLLKAASVGKINNTKKCLSCVRHDNINKINGTIKSRFNQIIKNLVVSEKITIIYRTLLISMLFFMFIDVYISVFTDYKFRLFMILSNILNLLFWTLMIIQKENTTIKKLANLN